MQKFLRDNGLTIVLLLLFAGSFAGQAYAGWAVENEDLRRHAATAMPFGAYIVSASFVSAVFENWESEFLSTAVLVVLSIFLRQRNSPESKALDAPHRATGC